MFLVYVVLCLIVFGCQYYSAIDCLGRLVSEMTYYVSSGTLNPTHSLTHSLVTIYLILVFFIPPSDNINKLFIANIIKHKFEVC